MLVKEGNTFFREMKGGNVTQNPYFVFESVFLPWGEVEARLWATGVSPGDS